MASTAIILRTSFQNIDDAIKLYKMARHQSGTPSITDIPGIVASAGNYAWQENSHQRELNIAAHVVNSGLYTDREIAEVIVLGGHQKHMPQNERRDMIDVVAFLKPWIINPALVCFQDIIDSLDVTIRTEFAARQSTRTTRWGLGWFGPLLKYDMALRIAYAHFQASGSTAYFPTEVYLYQGAKTGAKNLLGINPPAKTTAAAINPALATSGLSDEEIEDFLCVMHSFLSLGGVIPGQVAEVVCDRFGWLINRRLAGKIKRNHPIARMDALYIKKV